MTVPQQWRTSSYSSGANNCVEVRATELATLVRDTKNRGGGVLTFPADRWAAFTSSHNRRG